MKDKFQYASSIQKFYGCGNDIAQFFEREQLLDIVLWKRFVNQFREQIDGENKGWRGEYWGKMMRGGVMVYEYTHSEELYNVLTDTVSDMLTVSEENGRVSSFSVETEFTAWDMWCRKYVMLGLIYYYDICVDEELRKEIVDFLCKSTDYILEHIGKEDGKKEITSTSESWLGINASSILEAIVKLYNITGKEKYLDFASYIVEIGAAKGVNIFELAFDNKLYPYQYGVAKAYEMISCFEGLLEYYYATGIEKYKIASINFAKAIISSDVTIIGSCGCTHELFDHSKVRQTAKYEGVMQEICVTVTWMKYCARLLMLTGESIFADYLERAFYNAYAGALNTEHNGSDYIRDKFLVREKHPHIVDTLLPVDSYAPLTAGRRGVKVGGAQILSDKSYYGCCACISPAGVGAFLKHTVLKDEEGLIIEFFEKGEQIVSYNGHDFKLVMDTQYPADGKVKITINSELPCDMTLRIRVPEWSQNVKVRSSKSYVVCDSYIVIKDIWNGLNDIEIDFDMSIRVTYPISWDRDVIFSDMSDNAPGTYMGKATEVVHVPEDDNYVSFTYGPIVLCVDSRMGKQAGSIFAFATDDKGFVYKISDEKEIVPGQKCLVHFEFAAQDGKNYHLVDYLSAGRDWKSDIAAWIKVK